jgi:hypothetical protein
LEPQLSLEQGNFLAHLVPFYIRLDKYTYLFFSKNVTP